MWFLIHSQLFDYPCGEAHGISVSLQQAILQRAYFPEGGRQCMIVVGDALRGHSLAQQIYPLAQLIILNSKRIRGGIKMIIIQETTHKNGTVQK